MAIERKAIRAACAAFAFALCWSVASFAQGGVVNDRAREIFARIDALDVEHRWPAGLHVDWQSGLPDGKPVTVTARRKHTHCSAFVASAAKELGIYLLRPPEHKAALLANAQFAWLASTDGAAAGWRLLDGAEEAQRSANAGEFVVAVYRNHKPDRPGHIAIVRPSEKPQSEIAVDGPQITQAGGHNHRETTLREGFAGHPSAWGKKEVRFYAHAVEPALARREGQTPVASPAKK